MNTTEKTTDFQGPVSLDAILAATSKKTEGLNIKDIVVREEPKKEIQKQAAPIEEEETAQTPPTAIKTEEPIIAPTVNKKIEEESEAYKMATRMISLGMLEDFPIQTSEEDEDGTPISEFRTMSEENLKEIIDIQRQEKDKEISSKYIPKGNLREHELKVIEILQNGGDLSKIAETPEKAFERPFEGYDMDDQQRQIDVLYTDFTSGKGLSHDRAIVLIKQSVASGTIADEAKDVFEMYRGAHSKYIEEKLTEQKKEREFKDLNFKENKKSLTEKLKESGLKESVYKKVATEYGKRNEKGDYALLDKLREALDNPEKNFELILHLADKEMFNETFKIKSAQETHKAIIRLASGASAKGNKQSAKTATTEQDSPWARYAQEHNDKLRNN